MRCLNKVRKFSMIALLAAAPSFGFAEERSVTSQSYVDAKDALKQNIQIGAAPVGDTESTDAGKILVVDEDGKIAIATAETVTPAQVQANWAQTVSSASDYIKNKPGNFAAATASSGEGSTPTTGFVTGPAYGDTDKFLKGDGTWADVDAFPAGVANQVIQYNGTTNTWDAVTMDSAPTPSSLRPVTSGGVYNAVTGKVDIAQGTGTNNENVGKTLVVDSNGDLVLDSIDALPAGNADYQMLQYDTSSSEWGVVNIDTTPTAGHTVPVTSGGVATALDNKQTKPSSGVESGKVLTYTGPDANANVSAQYVHVPIADNNPSDSNNPGTVSGLVSVWVQQD